jgi:hypothetical protein
VRFLGNCLIVALIACLNPKNRLFMTRNAWGRLHWYWESKDGRKWRFYKAGSGRRTYLRNALYIGEIKEIV